MALYSARGASPDSAKKRKKKQTITIDEPRTPGDEPASDRRAERRAARSPRGDSFAGEGGPRDVGPSRQPQSPRSGGTSGAPPLAGSPSVRPNSAFGQQFIGASYPDLWTNPEVLAGEWMGGQGIDPQGGGGMWKVYSDLAQVMPQLFQLTQGMGGPEGATFASFLDYADQFLNQYSTPGAGTISPGVIGNLFSAGKDSPLGAMLNNPQLDPAQQANLLLGLMGAGLATSMPGATAGGYLGNAEALAQQWMGQQAKGGKRSFADYLSEQGFDDLFNF